MRVGELARVTVDVWSRLPAALSVARLVMVLGTLLPTRRATEQGGGRGGPLGERAERSASGASASEGGGPGASMHGGRAPSVLESQQPLPTSGFRGPLPAQLQQQQLQQHTRQVSVDSGLAPGLAPPGHSLTSAKSTSDLLGLGSAGAAGAGAAPGAAASSFTGSTGGHSGIGGSLSLSRHMRSPSDLSPGVSVGPPNTNPLQQRQLSQQFPHSHSARFAPYLDPLSSRPSSSQHLSTPPSMNLLESPFSPLLNNAAGGQGAGEEEGEADWAAGDDCECAALLSVQHLGGGGWPCREEEEAAACARNSGGRGACGPEVVTTAVLHPGLNRCVCVRV